VRSQLEILARCLPRPQITHPRKKLAAAFYLLVNASLSSIFFAWTKLKTPSGRTGKSQKDALIHL